MEIAEEVLTLTVDQGVGERLDQWLAARLTHFSRAQLSRLIRQQQVLVNQQTAKNAYKVRYADQIVVHLPEPEPNKVQPVAMELNILYEDEYLLAINKPPGLVVHPGAGKRQNTLVSGLLYYTQQLSRVGGAERPGLVHRLDKDTSGVLLVAKSDEVHWRLSDLFQKRQVDKEYLALVWGRPPADEGLIDAAIRRSPTNREKFVVGKDGRPAQTRYRLEEAFGLFSLVRLQLLTGRTHQARVHLQFLGNPVVGDLTYGGGRRKIQATAKSQILIGQRVMALVSRQLLHAARLGFVHPWTKEKLLIEAPLPSDFDHVLQILRESATHGV